ncbi:MAG: DNA translocase FtsK, partial [Oscillospiraceae bacterium]
MATKKPASSAKSSKKTNSNHLWSVVLFALGVLLLAIALISGESAWLVIHNILFGLFGPTAFLVPLVVIYAAIMIAQDKAEKAIWNKMIQGIVLLLLASSFVQVVIVGSVDGIDFVDKIINLYNDGMEFHSGGLLSAILGWPLLLLF